MQTTQLPKNATISNKKNTMKAIHTLKYGGPEVFKLVEINKPQPKENEVLIKIYAASVTAADTFMRKGDPLYGRLFLGLTKPKSPIPSTGFSGVIETIGGKVNKFKVGDKVFGESIFADGTSAEYVCVSEDGIIIKKPENITHPEACNICDGAVTSLNFLEAIGKIKSGQKLLINGASGSLGTAAIQIAKYFGAEVTAVCSERNIEFVKSLGADHTINYTQQDFTKTNQKFDVVYDSIGASTYKKCKKVLSKNGLYLSPVLSGTLLFQVLYTSIFSKQKAKFAATGLKPISEIKLLLEAVVSLIENDKLKVSIDRTYQLNQISEAHRFVDTGRKRGNIALVIHQD